jgi:hypothetical protein
LQHILFNDTEVAIMLKYLVVSFVMLASLWSHASANSWILSGTERAELPICLSRGTNACTSEIDGVCGAGEVMSVSPRVVVVGDVHGDFDGLLGVLKKANIVLPGSNNDRCTWAPQGTEGPTLIQIGNTGKKILI